MDNEIKVIKIFYLMNTLKLFWFVIGLALLSLNAYSQTTKSKIVFQNLGWAPDGKVIAFSVIKVKPDWSDYHPDKWKLFTYHLSSQKVVEIDSACLYFDFSPDGTKLAYDKSHNQSTDIYELDLKSKKPIKLTTDQAKNRAPSYSPNGKYVVFYSNRTGHEELHKMNLKNRKINQLTNRPNSQSYNPIWAPRGKHIVFYLVSGDDQDQIYLTDSRGKKQKNLTNDQHHNVYPSWTPKRRIIYTRNQGQLMIMNDDGSGKKELTPGPIGQAKVSPDGNSILISKRNGNLYLLNLKTHQESIVLHAAQLFPEPFKN